ncbi:MAG: radical SAM protein [Candidatus Diapherotrites archaeon]
MAMLVNPGDCFCFGKSMLKRGLPPYLMFLVTSDCNAECAHCLYWRKPNGGEMLSLREIEKISKNFKKLLFLNLGGGEPFTRKDLPEIAEIFSRNCRVKNISTTTNGILSKKIVSDTKRVLENCNSNFSVNVSLDAIGKVTTKSGGLRGFSGRHAILSGN